MADRGGRAVKRRRKTPPAAFGRSRSTILAVDPSGATRRVPLSALGPQLTQHERVLARRYGPRWRQARAMIAELQSRKPGEGRDVWPARVGAPS